MSYAQAGKNPALSWLIWLTISALGAFSLATVALHRGETINALWLVTAAICVYLVAYRFYSKFIAEKALGLDDSRVTPAVRRNDGLDYVPTDKWVLFGHHFAAIAGAGPLVGPVLAAQMGYLPGMLWLLVGVVFAGAVQDFVILFISTRRDGRSLGDLIRTEMGATAGFIAQFGVLAIMIILLAVLALVVVKALAGSPWGTFTVLSTLPTAVLMGLYSRYIRPGRIGEMSAIGFVLLMAGIFFGQTVSRKRDAGAALHLQGRNAGPDADRLWLHRLGASGVDPARAARLSFDLPEDRHDLRAGHRHRLRAGPT